MNFFSNLIRRSAIPTFLSCILDMHSAHVLALYNVASLSLSYILKSLIRCEELIDSLLNKTAEYWKNLSTQDDCILILFCFNIIFDLKS